MRTNLFILISCVVFFNGIPCLAHSDISEIVIKSGDLYKLPISPGAAVHIQKGHILKVRDLGTHLQVIGKKQGVSLITLKQKKYNFLVLTGENYETYTLLKKITAPFFGIFPSYHFGEIELQGRLYRLSDWMALASAFKATNSQYQFRAQLEPEIYAPFQKYINELLQTNHLLPGKWVLAPQIELHFSKNEKKFEPQLKNILRPFGLKPQFLDSALGLKPMIQVKVLIAEVSKESSKHFGVAWPDAYKVQLSQHSIMDPIDLIIQNLEGQGLSKTLASPTILSRSGTEAEFFAGGEIPIKSVSFQGSHVNWKPYGIELKVNAQADLTGQMSLTIHTSVSSLDKAHGDSQIPSIKLRKITSHIDLKNSQTIILSGLLKSDNHEDRGGLLFLQKIPVLGALFSSKNYLDNKTELVIFMTPSIIQEQEAIIEPKNHFPKNWDQTL